MQENKLLKKKNFSELKMRWVSRFEVFKYIKRNTWYHENKFLKSLPIKNKDGVAQVFQLQR